MKFDFISVESFAGRGNVADAVGERCSGFTEQGRSKNIGQVNSQLESRFVFIANLNEPIQSGIKREHRFPMQYFLFFFTKNVLNFLFTW